MKKIIAIILTAVMVCSLAACGSGTSSGAAPAGSGTSPAQPSESAAYPTKSIQGSIMWSAGGGGDDLAGIGQHIVEQILQRLVLGVLGDEDAAVAVAQQADGIEVVIVQLAGAHDLGNLRILSAEQQLVAVGGLGVHVSGGHSAAGAGPVGEDDVGAQSILRNGADGAGRHIADAAGGPHDGALDILGGLIGLCGSRALRSSGSAGSAGGIRTAGGTGRTGGAARQAGRQHTATGEDSKKFSQLIHNNLPFQFGKFPIRNL